MSLWRHVVHTPSTTPAFERASTPTLAVSWSRQVATSQVVIKIRSYLVSYPRALLVKTHWRSSTCRERLALPADSVYALKRLPTKVEARSAPKISAWLCLIVASISRPWKRSRYRLVQVIMTLVTCETKFKSMSSFSLEYMDTMTAATRSVPLLSVLNLLK